MDSNNLTTREGCLIGLGIVAFLVVCALLTDTSGPTAEQQEAQREQQEAPIISAIQQRYTPSPRLLTLNPNVHDGRWFALKNPVECTYGNPERKNCWKVRYKVTVMPEAETKEVECEWLIDMDTMQTQPLNTEARTMFLPD